jgi:putative toxin-antitoxin system antitoxin component (TIGR02293 family)
MAGVPESIGRVLGEEFSSDIDLARVVRRGLPLGVQAALLAHGLTREEFHSIVISPRTLKHRRARAAKGAGSGRHLSADESDKALRAARVLALAERVFASREKAFSWMRKAKQRFDGETPMQMLGTEAGARLVEQMLVQIDEGMVA